jgi:hypothetical protein
VLQEAKPKAILQKMGAYGAQLTTIQVRRQAATAAWRRRVFCGDSAGCIRGMRQPSLLALA